MYVYDKTFGTGLLTIYTSFMHYKKICRWFVLFQVSKYINKDGKIPPITLID